jgi:hypothetical protein
MRLLAVLALGLICSGLGFGCGGESSTRKDGGAGRAATSGVGGATAGAETTAATGGRSPRAGAGGVAGASGTGGSAGSVAGGGNAGVGGAGTGSGSGHGGGAGVLGEAGVPSAGEAGSAGAHEIPTKDGLPIGDCTDPTPEELAASGCPPELEYMAPCTEIGAICRTEIRTDASQTSQGYLTCQENGQLNVGVLLTCGSTCDVSAGNDAMLDATDCSSRPVTECDTSEVTYGVPPLAQQRADRELAQVIQVCGGFPIDNRIQVKLLNGCPYALSTTPTLSASIVDCLKGTLSQVRWSCAEDLMCASWAMFFM